MEITSDNSDDLTHLPERYHLSATELATVLKMLPDASIIHHIHPASCKFTSVRAFSDTRRGETTASDDLRVKILRFNATSESRRGRMLSEFAAKLIGWRKLKHHDNILTIVGVATDLFSFPTLGLASSWMGQGKSIMSYLKENPGHDRLTSIKNVAEGVRFLHENHRPTKSSFVHGNIKGDNVFVRPDGTCFLGEFGLTSQEALSDDPESPAVFEGCRWMAPELLNPTAFVYINGPEGPYGDGKARTSSDIYALASTALEIFTGEVPYYQYSKEAFVTVDVIRGILPGRRDEEKATMAGLTDDIWSLLQCLWRYSPVNRFGAERVCRILNNPSLIRNMKPPRLAPVFAATAAAHARRMYL